MITHNVIIVTDERGIAKELLIDGKNAGRHCTGYSIQHFACGIPSLELFVEKDLVAKYPCGTLEFEAAACDVEIRSDEDVNRERT